MKIPTILTYVNKFSNISKPVSSKGVNKNNSIKAFTLSSLMLMSMTPSLLSTAVKAQQQETQIENNLITQPCFSNLPTYIQPDCIEYSKATEIDGKKYTMYFVNMNKLTGDTTPSVTDVYLVPDDYEQILDKFVDEVNSPPRLRKIMPVKRNGKFTHEVFVSTSEITCNKKGKKIKNREAFFQVPANIGTDLLNLVSNNSKYRLLNEELKNTSIYEKDLNY